jgi:hypothetical protein
MPATEHTSLGIGHPAPHREAAPVWQLLFALFGAPAAWLLELLVNFATTSFVCDKGQSPAALPAVPAWVQPLISGANVLALVIAALSLVTGIILIRRTGEEHRPRSGEPIDAGEGRTRVLAVWAIGGAAVFLIALIANTFSLALVPICRP